MGSGRIPERGAAHPHKGSAHSPCFLAAVQPHLQTGRLVEEHS